MTETPREEHDRAHGVRSEEDRFSAGSVVAVGVGALVLFFLASFVTVAYLRIRDGDRPPLPVPAEVGSSKIGLVEQQVFDLATRGERDRAARLERLRSYGWVDRRAGVVHIPIDRAMELVSQGVRAAPSTQARTPGGEP